MLRDLVKTGNTRASSEAHRPDQTPGHRYSKRLDWHLSMPPVGPLQRTLSGVHRRSASTMEPFGARCSAHCARRASVLQAAIEKPPTSTSGRSPSILGYSWDVLGRSRASPDAHRASSEALGTLGRPPRLPFGDFARVIPPGITHRGSLRGIATATSLRGFRTRRPSGDHAPRFPPGNRNRDFSSEISHASSLRGSRTAVPSGESQPRLLFGDFARVIPPGITHRASPRGIAPASLFGDSHRVIPSGISQEPSGSTWTPPGVPSWRMIVYGRALGLKRTTCSSSEGLGLPLVPHRYSGSSDPASLLGDSFEAIPSILAALRR